MVCRNCGKDRVEIERAIFTRKSVRISGFCTACKEHVKVRRPRNVR
jgi:hypothetical protein